MYFVLSLLALYLDNVRMLGFMSYCVGIGECIQSGIFSFQELHISNFRCERAPRRRHFSYVIMVHVILCLEHVDAQKSRCSIDT